MASGDSEQCDSKAGTGIYHSRRSTWKTLPSAFIHARYAVVCSGILMLHLQLFPLSNETREEIHLQLHRDALPTTHVHNRIQSQTNNIGRAKTYRGSRDHGSSSSSKWRAQIFIARTWKVSRSLFDHMFPTCLCFSSCQFVASVHARIRDARNLIQSIRLDQNKSADRAIERFRR
jgi:hypothetical protein